MKVNSWVCVLIGLLFLTGMASADPFILTISSDKAWLVANGVDQATVTVNVKNSTSGQILPGATVTFNADSDHGSFSSPSATTDSSGNAAGTFKVKTRSGVATITASAQWTDTSTTPPTQYTSTLRTFEQNIDHDRPYKALFVYPLNGTVKTNVPFDAYLLDRWDNPIDSRRSSEIHTVTLHVHGPGSDDSGFVVGSAYPHDISQTLDPKGHISLMVHLASKPGVNMVMMDRVGSMGDQYKTIEGVATGIPFSIAALYSPLLDNEPQVQASTDPAKKFTIQYIVYDEFGNPTQDQEILIKTTSSDGTPEDQLLRTSDLFGQVTTYYGPKGVVSDWHITATAVKNTTVTTTQVLHFISAEPTNLEVSASPQYMPSLDANPGMYSVVSAKVIDNFGNPVDNEEVTFGISSPLYDCDECAVKGPSFSKSDEQTSTSATTQTNGIATVNVYPGSFKLAGDSGYKATATGNATVTATWNSVSHTIPIVWKNYPYLSVVTNISPKSVTVGQTVDVNLKLTGDGWKYNTKAIDVVITTDRSNSMQAPKMADAIAAGKIFNALMSSQDRVGLVSFGVSNRPCPPAGCPSYAPIDLGMTYDRSQVDTILGTYTKDASGTPTREALHNATKLLLVNPRQGAVRAILIVTDGWWNDGGDPDAASNVTCEGFNPGLRASWPGDGITSDTSVIDWAKTNNILIYSVLIEDPNAAHFTCEQNAAKSWADKTGGKYYHAATSSELDGIYTQIAGELHNTASVDTSVSLDLKVIPITSVFNTSGDAFEYIGDPTTPGVSAGPPVKAPGSTMIDKYNASAHSIPGPEYTTQGPLYKNQTKEWNENNHNLKFSIGTITLGETWETNIRLRVLKNGSYSLFGPNSQICFKDPNDLNAPQSCLSLANQSSFTANPGGPSDTLGNQILSVSKPVRTDGTGDLFTTFPVQWTISYTGTDMVTEKVSYVHDDDPPVPLGGERPVRTGPFADEPRTATLVMAPLPLGTYRIHVDVYSYSPDSPIPHEHDWDDSDSYIYRLSDRPFIKLE
jgi:hypothetical protein